MNLSKYKQNLKVNGFGEVLSYNTHVASIDYKDEVVNQLGWWSTTTQKHINYVASELGFDLNRNGY